MWILWTKTTRKTGQKQKFKHLFEVTGKWSSSEISSQSQQRFLTLESNQKISLAIKAKTDQLDFIKIKNFCLLTHHYEWKGKLQSGRIYNSQKTHIHNIERIPINQ